MRGDAITNGVGVAVLLLLLIAAPFILPGHYYLGVLTIGLIYSIWVVSWDFMSGLTGRINFGQGLFFGLGAYFVAYLNTHYDWSVWLSFPIGIAVAAVAAAFIGIPTLRLRGPYFALATFAAMIVVQRVTLNLWQVTGADEGISGIAPLFISRLRNYYFVLLVAASITGILLILRYSRFGVILRAIGGDEATCSAAGLNVTYFKILSLVISSVLGAVGGVVYAHYQQHIGPELFSLQLGLMIITMAYLGGVGSIYGGAIAAILLSFLTEFLRPFGEWRLAAYSVVLIMVLFMLPNGLVAPLWEAIRSRVLGNRERERYTAKRDGAREAPL